MVVRPLSRAEVRGIDARAVEEFGLPTLVLMENAGRGAADSAAPSGDPALLARAGGLRPGNNGGDGGVVARHLDASGVAVRVVWFGAPEQLRGDAAVQWTILARSGIDQTSWFDTPSDDLTPLLSEADWIVDALLGTGLTRPVEGVLRTAIEALNRSGKPVLALDLPSGLDADSGQPLGCAVQATATATFVAPKLGFDAVGAHAYTGAVVVVPIGIPRLLLESFRAS